MLNSLAHPLPSLAGLLVIALYLLGHYLHPRGQASHARLARHSRTD